MIKLHRIFYLKKIYLNFSIGNGQRTGTSTVPIVSAHFRSLFGGRRLKCQDSLEPTALPRPSWNWLSGIIEIVAKEERKDGGD